MADLLAQPQDLDDLLGETVVAATANLLLEIATGAVQAAAGQRLVEVADDTTPTLLGTFDRWFELPERPVSSVTSVTVDGEAVTDFKRFGSRLWRTDGWAASPHVPGEVVAVYSHGYATTDHRLTLAKDVTLMLAAQAWENPTATTGMSIDDFRIERAQATDALLNQLPKHVTAALQKQYGRRGGLVRFG